MAGTAAAHALPVPVVALAIEPLPSVNRRLNAMLKTMDDCANFETYSFIHPAQREAVVALGFEVPDKC